MEDEKCQLKMFSLKSILFYTLIRLYDKKRDEKGYLFKVIIREVLNHPREKWQGTKRKDYFMLFESCLKHLIVKEL
jgi:hypothetical protein